MLSHDDVTPPKANITLCDAHPEDPLAFSGVASLLLPCILEPCLLSGSKGRDMLRHDDVTPLKANITLCDAHPVDQLSFPGGCQHFCYHAQ
jgi:hypothetical protein